MTATRPAAVAGRAPIRAASPQHANDEALCGSWASARLWHYLERHGIAYCVLGSTGGGGDIDIVVGGLDGPAIAGLLQGFCRENGVRLAQVLHHEHSGWYFVLAWHDDDGVVRFLHLDVCGDYMRGGRTILNAGEILAGRTLVRDGPGAAPGHPVPTPSVEFICYLVKKIDKQEIADRHGDCLSTAWHAHPDGARAALARFWSEADCALLGRAARNNDWSEVRAALPRLRRALRRRLPWPAVDRWRELMRRFARALRPTGLTVAVLGPDGSGKSSLIAELLPMLAPAFRRTRRLHLRPRLIAFGGAGATPVDDPHGTPARGAIASTAKILYFLFDYWTGHAVKLWPLRARSTLVLFDRYYHDLLADPARYRYGGSSWLAALGAKLVPKPDLWIVLDVPAETLQTRKQEVPAAESARQRQAYRDLAARLDNSLLIDATQPLEHVVATAARAVIDRLTERLARRLG